MAERGNSPRTGVDWVGTPIPDEGGEGYIPRSVNVTGPRASGSNSTTAAQVSAQPGEVDQHAVPEAAQRAQGQRPDRHRIPRHPRRSSGDRRGVARHGLWYRYLRRYRRADRQGDWWSRVVGRGRTGDLGQAFPIYVTVIAAILFLSFAYFAVGQATASRSDAQGAADASALAAANEAREQIGKDLLADIDDLDDWEDLLAGLLFPTGPSCAEAESFATKNSASSTSCSRVAPPRRGFKVGVETDDSVGSSIIPGTDSTHSTATATAVIEPLCTLQPGEGGGDEIKLNCKSGDLEIDPDDPDPLPELDDLFTVRLVE